MSFRMFFSLAVCAVFAHQQKKKSGKYNFYLTMTTFHILYIIKF